MPLHETNVGANIQGHTTNNLRFADDIALIAESEEELQTLVDHSSSTLGLKININKTEVQNISKEPKHIHIMIDGKELTQVDNFTYLGGIISQDVSNSQDIKQRIGKAMGAVQKLYNIWNSTNIRESTKTELCPNLAKGSK